MKKNKILSFVICAAGLALCAWRVPPAGGQTPPGLINFQGRLTDAANNPLSGAQDFVFEIYDSLSGGVRLWLETQNGIPVANGVLAAQLGAAVPVPASVFSSPSAYLQITVGGVTLAPRQRLVTAPYAFNSYSLQGRGYDAFVSTDAAAQSIAGTKTFTGVLASAQLRLAGGVVISSEALSSLGGGVRVSSNVYIVGFSSAAKYYGDGSALTGISVPGDGLGSHTAAQDLNMAGRQILNVASMTITGKDAGSGYSLYLSSGINMAGGTVNAGLFVGSGAGLSGVLASSVAAAGVRPGSLAPGAVSASAQLADSVITLAKFGQSGCAANQVPKWNGAAWACAADVGSAYLADEASLHLSGGAFSALPSSVTLQGNSFNGASQLLRLTPGGALPALNGAALLSVSSVAVNSVRDEAIVSVSGSKVAGNISGAAGSVANGVYTTGAYSDPLWITALSTAKINLSTVTAALDLKADASAVAAALAGKLSNTATVPPGLVDLSSVTAALAGKLDTGAQAASVANGVYTTGAYGDPSWITALSTAKINLSTVTAALDLKADASAVAAALAGKLSNTATVPPGLIDLSTVTAALAAGVPNGVYTTGSYNDPAWITRLATGKIDLSTVTTALNGKLDTGAQSASVANGVYTTGAYNDPAWITRLATGKIDLSTVTAALNGKLDTGAQAASVANGVYTTGDQTIGGNKTFSSIIEGSVSGNAAAATKLNSQGDYANGTPGTTRGPAGLNLFQVYNNGYPIPYGNVLQIGGAGAGQLLVGWSGADGSHVDNYVRSKRDNDSGAWSPWAKLLTDVNYNAYAPSLTGTGASGTWGISVTGNSGGFTGALAGDVSGTQGATVVADDSHNHHYALGTYISGGGEAPNYFGSDKLKLQMLTCPWTWCDTLWMSSYGGSDVKGSNQLVFSKYGANAGFRRQDYDSGAWGTLYEFIHTGNMGILQSLQSLRDFTVGTLIQSDIDYSLSEGDTFLLEIGGNSYGSAIPFDIKLQGYIYSNTIINHGAISNGTNITGLVAFNYNGKLCFWFPRQAYWQGVNVFINSSYAGVKRNRVVSITDSAKPGGVTKEVAFTIQQGLHTGNLAALSGRSLPLSNDYPVSQMLRWKNYGGGHVIFDASAGTSPEGGAVNQTNSAAAWTPSYPTLMGWNGTSTYGVRVDMARYAESAGNSDTVDGHHFNWSGQGGQPAWLWGGNDSDNMYVYNPSNFSVNYAASAGNISAGASPTVGTLHFYGVGGNSGQAAPSSDYRIYQAPGAWSHPYPDLNIAYHTGISIGAYYAYGGTRFFNNSDMVTELMSVGNTDNNVRVAYNLYVAGNEYVSGTAYASTWEYISNRRSKTDITDNNYGIAEVMRLQAKNYKLIADKTQRPQIGFIAEEVAEVIPELVSHNAEGLAMGLDYGRLTVVLIEAVKDQQGEIEKLRAENEAIKLRLTALENK